MFPIVLIRHNPMTTMMHDPVNIIRLLSLNYSMLVSKTPNPKLIARLVGPV